MPPLDHFVTKSFTPNSSPPETDAAFAVVATWADKNRHGRELYIGEFGAHDKAHADSRRAYVKAVTTVCARHHWSWAVWDYQGGFAIRTRGGKPTAIIDGLPLK